MGGQTIMYLKISVRLYQNQVEICHVYELPCFYTLLPNFQRSQFVLPFCDIFLLFLILPLLPFMAFVYHSKFYIICKFWCFAIFHLHCHFCLSSDFAFFAIYVCFEYALFCFTTLTLTLCCAGTQPVCIFLFPAFNLRTE